MARALYPLLEHRFVVLPAVVQKPVALKICVLILFALFDLNVGLEAGELFAHLIGAQLVHRKGKIQLCRDGQQHRFHQRLADLETAGIAGYGFLHTRVQSGIAVVLFKKPAYIFSHNSWLLYRSWAHYSQTRS